MFQDFKNDLQRALTLPLPGKEGQAPLKPYLQVNKSIDAPALPNKRKGAVMSLIYPVNNIPHILFIERPIYDGVHSGQIAFPGGKIESSDPSNLAAALRETKEEIGIESNIIDVYIKRLRSKIEKVGHPKILQSIRGVGYRMREVSPDDTEQIEDYSDDE